MSRRNHDIVMRQRCGLGCASYGTGGLTLRKVVATVRTQRVFEVRIRGENVSPETLSASVLADLLPEIEKAIRAVARQQRPTFGDEDFVLGLVGVRRGSSILAFSSSKVEEAEAAFQGYTEALAKFDVTALPPEARSAALSTSEFAKRKNVAIEFSRPYAPPIARITPESELTFVTPHVQGETTIYGIVERVGGKEPKIRLAVDGGKTIACSASRQLVKQVGNHLYERVGIRGIAKWDSADWSIVDFFAQELIDFIDTPLDEAIAMLAQASGPSAWPGDDEDTAETLRAIRGE